MAPPKTSSAFTRNAVNAVLLVAVALPAIYYASSLHTCSPRPEAGPAVSLMDVVHSPSVLVDGQWWCTIGKRRPMEAVNLVFMLNVCVLFWIISLAQRSTWLIDPYWTIIPVLIGLFYQHHPHATADALRSRVAMGLLWAWSIRLTHSYFRREEWQLGAREDWRFAEMSKQFGGHWWWASFFITYVAQQLMLVGITLPLYAVHASAAPWHPLWDSAAAAGCVVAIIGAYFADTQLREYMVQNERRAAARQPKVPLLNTGLWRYSRHPNYFFEQLWWWCLALFAARLGHGWMVVGTAFNSLCMIQVTVMTEARMARVKSRAALFREYQRVTSVWFPWPQRPSPILAAAAAASAPGASPSSAAKSSKRGRAGAPASAAATPAGSSARKRSTSRGRSPAARATSAAATPGSAAAATKSPRGRSAAASPAAAGGKRSSSRPRRPSVKLSDP